LEAIIQPLRACHNGSGDIKFVNCGATTTVQETVIGQLLDGVHRILATDFSESSARAVSNLFVCAIEAEISLAQFCGRGKLMLTKAYNGKDRTVATICADVQKAVLKTLCLSVNSLAPILCRPTKRRSVPALWLARTELCLVSLRRLWPLPITIIA
jgi:hypothetical protein